MFIDFFYELKNEGVPVSLTEWMTLMEALAKDLSFSSLTGFYYLARAVLVKSEAHYDRYDIAFAKYFKGLETTEDILEKALEWLNSPQADAFLFSEKRLTKENVEEVRLQLEGSLKKQLSQWDIDKMRQQLEDRLKNQKKEHSGGPHWIGSGGTSPFGQSGFHQSGLRVGGDSGNLSAVKVAAKRAYREFRDDKITGVRQFEVALRKLRQLSTRTDGPKSELDLDGTIDATSRNAGMLKLVWDRPRRNMIKVVILMDSGGSMDRYIQICSRLFTAVNRATHFKDMKFYYFHNCIYDYIYKRPFIEHKYAVKTEEVLRTLNPDYRLIIVGDASMAPSELTMVGGAIDWWMKNDIPGITWLKRISRRFPYSVWLNPVPEPFWGKQPEYYTISMVQKVFPMYELTPDGIEKAVKRLKAKVI